MKNEVENMNNNLIELTEEEMEQVSGGFSREDFQMVTVEAGIHEVLGHFYYVDSTRTVQAITPIAAKCYRLNAQNKLETYDAISGSVQAGVLAKAPLVYYEILG